MKMKEFLEWVISISIVLSIVYVSVYLVNP